MVSKSDYQSMGLRSFPRMGNTNWLFIYDIVALQLKTNGGRDKRVNFVALQIASVKSRSTRRVLQHATFMGSCLNISKKSLPCLHSRWVLLMFLILLIEIKTVGRLRFHLFVSDVNQKNEVEGWIQDCLVLPQGCESFPSGFPRVRWFNLVHMTYL